MGHHPPSDAFIKKEDYDKPSEYFPLNLMYCGDCGLSQLGYVVNPEVLYQRDYPYESSTTETGKKHYFSFAESVVRKFNLTKEDLVIDIGSNVGVLLEGFKNNGTKVLGVDPAPNIVEKANARGIPTICKFFGEFVSTQVAHEYGKAKVITGTNVFAHVDDLKDFMFGIKHLLTSDGIFIFESPNMLDLVKGLAYDTIYHEHLSYLSLRPVIQFVKQFGMDVIAVEEQSIHGGSFRVFIANSGEREIEESVQIYLKKESDYKLHETDTMFEFSARVENNRRELQSLINKIKDKDKTLAILSAPAKGMSLLNYCRFGTETFDFATEKSPLKIGRLTPGGNIPVVPDAVLLESMPDYVLLLAWNFAEEIMKNNEEYRTRGGKFIIPLPYPKVIE